MTLEQIIEFSAKLWSNIQYFIAGAIGAAIVTRYHKDQLKNPTDYFVFILSGAMVAHYLTQLVVYFVGLSAENAGAIGFLLGAFGGMFIQEFISYFKSGAWKEMSLRQYFVDLFKAWLNRKK